MYPTAGIGQLPRIERLTGAHIIAVHVLVTITLLLFVFVATWTEVSASHLLRPLSILQIALLAWMGISWYWLTGTVFDPYFLFVATAAVFHCGQVLLECLDLNPAGFLYGWFSQTVCVQTLYLVMFSFALLHLGAIAGIKGRRRVATGGPLRPAPPLKAVRLLGWVLLAISIVPAFLVLKDALSAAMSGGYFFAMFAREAPTGFAAVKRVLASFLVPAALFLLAGSERRLPLIAVSGVVVLTYAALYLFIGSRTVAAVSIVAYAWLWHRVIRPLPTTGILVSAALALFAVFPLVSAIRTESAESRTSASYLMERWSSIENPATDSLSETGASLVTVAYTVELMPRYRDFGFGSSYAMAVLTVFPNIFWELHPGVGYGTPANWMLEMVDPQSAAKGGGLGYSFIAEAYFNFGWMGPVAVATLGYCLGAVVRCTNGRPDPVRLAAAANLLPPLLWYVRNEASGAARSIVWFSVLPYLAILVLASSRRRLL